MENKVIEEEENENKKLKKESLCKRMEARKSTVLLSLLPSEG
jgi:hypothetical protein